MLRHVRLCLLSLAVLTLASSAMAQSPWYGSYGGWDWGLSAGAYNQSIINQRTPPYYALHPPVYYSGEIIRRPYGTSPFASFDRGGCCESAAHGGSSAPSASYVRPALIENPYYVPSIHFSAPPARPLGRPIAPPIDDEIPPPKPAAGQAVEPKSIQHVLPASGPVEGVMIHNPHVRSNNRVALNAR